MVLSRVLGNISKLASTRWKNKYTIGNKLDGRADSLRFGFGLADADLLWIGRTERDFRFVVRCFVRHGIGLWLSTGHVALWFSRINLVACRAQAMAAALEK
jgi:hypothetical protein